MEPTAEDSVRPYEPKNNEYVKKTINWIYFTIIGVPLILYTTVLVFLSSFTPIAFLGDWQIWSFMGAIPVLGFIGGFFLKQEELQKSLLYGCLFLAVIMALVTSGLAGGAEIVDGSSAKEILLAFFGGIIYGGSFGLIDSVFLILTTLGAYGIIILAKKRK